MKYIAFIPLALATSIVSCSGQQQSAAIPQSASIGLSGKEQGPSRHIQHVVVIFQENRTPDDLFQPLASEGANIQSWGMLGPNRVNLKQKSLATFYGLGHGHKSFVLDYDCGLNDGFSSQIEKQFQMRPYSYAPQSEVQPYTDMAEQYVFGDNMFQTQQAGSFPAHQYLISASGAALPATTFDMSSDPFRSSTGMKSEAGCDGPPDEAIDTINPSNGKPGPTPRPCFNRPVLTDLLDFHGV